MITTPLPCPKCGCRTWDGPRWVATIPGDSTYKDYSNDGLSYTCTDCRFVRYEEPLDRRTTIADLDLGKGRNIWVDK